MQTDREKLLAWIEKSKLMLTELESGSAEEQSLAEIIRQVEDGIGERDLLDDTDFGMVNLGHLKDTLTELEVSHPRVTGIMNDLMLALSSMGI